MTINSKQKKNGMIRLYTPYQWKCMVLDFDIVPILKDKTITRTKAMPWLLSSKNRKNFFV